MMVTTAVSSVITALTTACLWVLQVRVCNFGHNTARNEPGSLFKVLQLEGQAFSAGISASHPFILSQSHQLEARLGLRLTNEDMTTFGQRLYQDRTRCVDVAAAYDFQDSWQGHSRAQLLFSHGFNGLGARETGSAQLSRDIGVSDFTKVKADVSYNRPLVDNFSVSVSGPGQYAFKCAVSIGVNGARWSRQRPCP